MPYDDEINPSTPDNAIITQSINIRTDKDNQSVFSRISSLRSTPGSAKETAVAMSPPVPSSAPRNIAHSRTFVAIDTIVEGEDENTTTQSRDTDADHGETSTIDYSMPRYCMKTSKTSSTLSTFTIDIANVLTEIEEAGDRGDSDVNGDLIEQLDDARMDALIEKRVHMEEEEVAAFSDRNIIKLSEDESKSPDEELKQFVPSIPETWTPDEKKANEPEFNEVDNPGNWNWYIFRPEFESQKQGGKYKGNFLATGATPVPLGVDGQSRSINKWNFYYNGWEGTNKW